MRPPVSSLEELLLFSGSPRAGLFYFAGRARGLAVGFISRRSGGFEHHTRTQISHHQSFIHMLRRVNGGGETLYPGSSNRQDTRFWFWQSRFESLTGNTISCTPSRTTTPNWVGVQEIKSIEVDMLTPEGLKNLSKADEEDQHTIFWVLSRMQVELATYLKKHQGEPGSSDTHDYIARKVQTYIGSLMRELSKI